MSPRSIERAIYVGGAVLAALIVALLLVSPVEAIWTAAIIFGVAAVALGIEILVLGARHRRRGRPHRSAHSPSAL